LTDNGRVLLRYTGELAVSFNGAGHVEPQGEFEVAAGDAERFTRRADVERVVKAVKAKAKPEADGGKPPVSPAEHSSRAAD
jgi:hypothetical protein